MSRSTITSDSGLQVPRSVAGRPAMGRGPDRPVLLIVEDDPSTRAALTELLERDWDVLGAEDGTEAVALIQAHVPDLVLADLSMPRLGGMGLLETLQGELRTREVPVVFLSGQSDPRTVVDCFSHGAADFIAKPGRPDELRARLLHAWSQARRVARLESLARTDALTDLHNFRALQSKLDEEFARATRYAEPLALLLVDVDNLKTLNDQYGHEAGNAALRAMGEVFRAELHRLADKHPCIGEVRGLGCFWGLELVKNRETREPLVPFNGSGEAAKPVASLAKDALSKGLYLMTHWNVVMVCPPLTITREELDEGIAILDEALSVADEFVV